MESIKPGRLRSAREDSARRQSVPGVIQAARKRRDSARVVNGNEEVGLVIGATRRAFGFDLPVCGWCFGQQCGVLICGQGEFEGDFAASEAAKVVAGKREGLLVEFEANDARASIVTCS